MNDIITVSLIDDNTSILTTLSMQFQNKGYKTFTFSNPEKALEFHEHQPADCYIIDYRMNEMNGLEFYRDLCLILNKDRLPALFLTGLDNRIIEEKALRESTIGDFVLKPFSFSILLARLEKILSYFKIKEEQKIYKLGNLEMYEDQILCKWKGIQIELTKTEYILLDRLVRRPNCVNSRGQLLDVCYNQNLDISDRNIDSHIKRLRKKFRASCPDINFNQIKTLYGSGYSWQHN